ncbi:hypothetical protein EDB89DRAFT_1913640 [Lactarius sanguifluus]|nr:hypothetical protein EDB89DRAFT_1913640 [Lactarius sanguifluus]
MGYSSSLAWTRSNTFLTSGDIFGPYTSAPPRVSSRSDYLADSLHTFLTSTAELQGDVQIASGVDVDIDSPAMPLGRTFSFSTFVSGIYLGKITRNITLLALIEYRLKRQETVQEYPGYAPGEVSLRDRRAPDVLRQRVLVGHRTGRGVGGRRQDATSLDGSLYQHYFRL